MKDPALVDLSDLDDLSHLSQILSKSNQVGD